MKMKSFRESFCLIFVVSILAGICIGIAGAVYLVIRGTFAGSNIVGALMFSIGLFTICTRGYNLFTGSVCNFSNYGITYIFPLIVILVGNFIGTLLIALLFTYTSLCGVSGINIVAKELVTNKMNSSYLSLFLLGIACNIFIYIAVKGYSDSRNCFKGVLAIILGVSCFVILGTEHSIADMFYWEISGVLFPNFGASVSRILIIVLGNAVGGIILSYVEKYTTNVAVDVTLDAVSRNNQKDIKEKKK